MQIILETDRLYLRELTTADAENIYKLNSDEEVIRYTGDKPFSNVQEAFDFLSNYKDYRQNGFGRWGVFLKEKHEFIGWCGLKLHQDEFVDLGYRFFRNHWNKGYATEAALACVKYGFEKLKLPFIVGRVSGENKASINVLEKVGMTFWKLDPCEGIEDAFYYRIMSTVSSSISETNQ